MAHIEHAIHQMSFALVFSMFTLYVVMHCADIAVFYCAPLGFVIRYSACLIFLKMFALSDKALISATCPNA